MIEPTRRAFPRELIRADLADFAGYSSARTSAPRPAAGSGGSDHDPIWLNANESGTTSAADPDGSVRRYPDPQPPELVRALAETYGVDDSRLVVGRGSDEAIDLLIRAICTPGADAIVTAPPTFGMYAVSSRLHGTTVREVPLRDEGDRWQVDIDQIIEAVGGGSDVGDDGTPPARPRIVFLASPDNPTGRLLPPADLVRLLDEIGDHAVVVIDEAYQEFAEIDGATSAIELLDSYPTLVVLRTLSKAHALAAARVGVALTHPDLAAVLRRVQTPYPIPAPVTELTLSSLTASAAAVTAERTRATVRGRERLRAALDGHPLVAVVYPSAGNFVLIRAADAGAADRLFTSLQEAGIVIRDFRGTPGLEHSLRITAGSSSEVDAVRDILGQLAEPAATTTTIRSSERTQ